MTKILLSYRITLNEPLTSHRKQLWFNTMKQANTKLRKLLQSNLQTNTFRYSEFRITETKMLIRSQQLNLTRGE